VNAAGGSLPEQAAPQRPELPVAEAGRAGGADDVGPAEQVEDRLLGRQAALVQGRPELRPFIGTPCAA